MGYGYGRGGRRGYWPGNGPFRNLPPWERPGWLYGPGSCWYLGYRSAVPLSEIPPPTGNVDFLEQEKKALENQLNFIQERLKQIETRLRELEEAE